MDPYSAPKSDVSESSVKSRAGAKFLGGVCIFIASLFLLSGIPQIFRALIMVRNANGLTPGGPEHAMGYLLGTLVAVFLAGLLFRFGLRKFKGVA